MKATAVAPANIAFIKYWGKKDEKLRLPLNSSISMNLSALITTTTVEFSDKYLKDEIESTNNGFSDKEKERVITHLDLIRKRSKISTKAKVASHNTFATSAGLASSASGFAALTVAGCKAAELVLTEKELTILARLGSGSACRSIPDGFVMWQKGVSSESSFAHSLYPVSYWDLRDIICLVADEAKKTSSTHGMENVRSSPFLKTRLTIVDSEITDILHAFKEKDFEKLGNIIEQDTINMHAVAMTQKPAIFYWNNKTIEIIHQILKWRDEGLPVYFTIDAGPNLHLICESKNEQKILNKIKSISEIKEIIINKPAEGTKLIDKHLF